MHFLTIPRQCFRVLVIMVVMGLVVVIVVAIGLFCVVFVLAVYVYGITVLELFYILVKFISITLSHYAKVLF